MKTPKKVIEKISLPLMFGMFVMAVLVFAVSPVSAAPGCVDADGDLYDKFHRKHCPEGDDPDDSDCSIIPAGAPVLNPDCDNVDTTSTVYTATLTAGAFIFVDGDGVPIPPIEVITGSNKDIGLLPLEDDVEMWRPTNPDEQATWDRMFYIGCPELGTSIGVGGFKITKIKSTYNDWSIEEPGDIRLILRDIRLTAGGVDWDVTVQLIGSPNYDPYPNWLPAAGEQPHVFDLTRGVMWGREVSGGPGGRQSCHQADNGTEERMGGFFLWNPATCSTEQCKNDATSVMQIVNIGD